MNRKRIELSTVPTDGMLVAIVATDHGTDVAMEAHGLTDDLAILYPNGQFRRVILDSEGFAQEIARNKARS